MVMLLKFTSPSLFNSNVIDCATGAVVYRVVTTGPPARTRARSAASFYSFASSSSSRERVDVPLHKTTSMINAQGNVVAEITWEYPDDKVIGIRIGEECLAGNQDIFDPSFVRVSPDGTLIPTRMEYVWRTTPDELELLDDDSEVIGCLHEDSIYVDSQLSPAAKKGSGHSYLDLTGTIPADEIVEILITFLLMTTLRARMYWLTKYLYGRNAAYGARYETKTPFQKLRSQAKRSFANLRCTLLRKSS